MPNGFTADTSELQRFAAQLERKAATVRAEVAAAVQSTAHDIAETAKQLVPVASGATRDSIHVVQDQLRDGSSWVAIGPTTPYAHWIEFGTSEKPPRPFLLPARDRHAPELAKTIADIATRVER